MKRFLKFLRIRRNWFGFFFIGFLFAVSIATPVLAPQVDPNQPNDFLQVGRASDTTPRPPSETAFLGTLPKQYDVYYSLLWGLRQALSFGLSATIITAAFGIIYGATSGYLGGSVNNLMMRIADAFLTFPMIAAIVFMRQLIVIFLENTGVLLNLFYTIPEKLSPYQQSLINFDPVLWALVLFSWMPYARLTNASVMHLRNADFIISARALGASNSRVIFHHLLPNTISPEIVLAARDVGGMVILQATFTFIGLGGTSPWGRILAIARDWIVGPGGNPFAYWWTYLPTTFALILFGISWNLLGDSLNDWINPRKSAL